MNYRHGYHAGNHTESFKHAVLLGLLEFLKSKDKPFAVLDTHAGAGLHDLRSDMALRTREADDGIVRLMSCAEPALAGYLDIVRAVGGSGPSRYPGSPEIIRRVMRPADRLIACELHPDDAARLRSHMASDLRVGVHERDGYEASLALVPPRERRGLVFMDPPFEDAGEFARLGDVLAQACAKWPTGTYVAWYPIKSAEASRAMRAAALRSPAKGILSASFLRFSLGDARLSGSGMVVLNPPWRAREMIADVCGALRRGFGAGEWTVDALRDG